MLTCFYVFIYGENYSQDENKLDFYQHCVTKLYLKYRAITTTQKKMPCDSLLRHNQQQHNINEKKKSSTTEAFFWVWM
jgi:hypothetical protein